MKIFKNLFVLTIVLTLVLTLSACGKEEANSNSGPDESSKPTVSTPTENNTTTDESKPEDNKQDESKPTEISKPQTSTITKPEENKIPVTSIIGQWKTKIDASEILSENEIEIDKQIYINVKTVFGNDNSYCVSITPLETEQILKASLSDEYDEDFINNCVSLLDDALYESGVYKFEDDKLLIMWDGDPDYIEIAYNFKNSKDKLTISFPSDERDFERIK